MTPEQKQQLVEALRRGRWAATVAGMPAIVAEIDATLALLESQAPAEEAQPQQKHAKQPVNDPELHELYDVWKRKER